MPQTQCLLEYVGHLIFSFFRISLHPSKVKTWMKQSRVGVRLEFLDQETRAGQGCVGRASSSEMSREHSTWRGRAWVGVGDPMTSKSQQLRGSVCGSSVGIHLTIGRKPHCIDTGILPRWSPNTQRHHNQSSTSTAGSIKVGTHRHFFTIFSAMAPAVEIQPRKQNTCLPVG